MKKPLFSRIKFGSLHVMMGVCFIFIQEAYGCPILSCESFTGLSSAGPWSSQLNYALFKKVVTNESISHLRIGAPEAGFVRFSKLWRNKTIKNLVYIDSSWPLSGGIIPLIRSDERILAGKSSSPFLIYDPCSLNSSGLEKLLVDSPGIDFDFIRTFFTGIPHGKWAPEDIWTSVIPSSIPVPEPSTMLILGSGLIGIALFGRKPND